MLSDVQAEFLKNARGDAFIRFFDPAYVRADIILLDRKNKSLYAVLHEQEHYIGALDEEMADLFAKNKDVYLTAMMSGGKKVVNLRAKLSITE